MTIKQALEENKVFHKHKKFFDEQGNNRNLSDVSFNEGEHCFVDSENGGYRELKFSGKDGIIKCISCYKEEGNTIRGIRFKVGGKYEYSTKINYLKIGGKSMGFK